MLVTAVLLIAGLVCVFELHQKPERISLFITAVIGAITTVYALFTYEIMLQNQTMAASNQDMAAAALQSSSLMEKSLRFSHAANLLFETLNVKDPTFKSDDSTFPIETPEYKRALAEFNVAGEQKEFVFAVMRNAGQGAATNLQVNVAYNVSDSSNPNRESTVAKSASLQILEPNKSAALCVFISKVPTPGDRVALVSATIKAGDFYRDAIGEAPQQIKIEATNHHVRHAADSVVRVC
jgi:hypothetical protein